MLAGLAIADMVPDSDEQRERLNRLAAAGYVVLVNRKRLYANSPREPAYRLTVRGRAYAEGRKAGLPKE